MRNKKAYSLIIGLLAFSIFVFLTTNIYSDIVENNQVKDDSQKKLKKLDTKLQGLNTEKNSKNSKNITKFLVNFSEIEIFNYINEYIEQVNNANKTINIEFGSINFSESKKSDIGFKEIDIDLKLKTIKDIDNLNAILNYLTNPNNKYSFFITSFSFPIEKSGPYKNISIPLRMFIK